jgi:hypothetical protein
MTLHTVNQIYNPLDKWLFVSKLGMFLNQSVAQYPQHTVRYCQWSSIHNILSDTVSDPLSTPYCPILSVAHYPQHTVRYCQRPSIHNILSDTVCGPVSTTYCPILSRVSPYTETNSGTVRPKNKCDFFGSSRRLSCRCLNLGWKLWWLYGDVITQRDMTSSGSPMVLFILTTYYSAPRFVQRSWQLWWSRIVKLINY